MGNSEIRYYVKDALKNAKTTKWGETTGNRNMRQKTNNVDEMESYATRLQDISESRYTQPRYKHREISDKENHKIATAMATARPQHMDTDSEDNETIHKEITIIDKDRVAGKVTSEDIENGFRQLQLDQDEIEAQTEKTAMKHQDTIRKGPGGGGGTPQEKAVSAIIKIHENEKDYDENKISTSVYNAHLGNNTNILGLALMDAGCHVVEAIRETYVEQEALGQKAVVMIPCKKEGCGDLERYCGNGHLDTYLRKEPDNWKTQQEKREWAEAREARAKRERGEELTRGEQSQIRKEPVWMEVKCPIIYHTVIAGDTSCHVVYNAATTRSAGDYKARTNKLRTDATKRLRMRTLRKLAEKMYKEADNGNTLKTEEGLRENLMEAWESFVERYNWEHVQMEWLVPSTECVGVQLIKGYMFSKRVPKQGIHKINPKDTTSAEEKEKLKHIGKAILDCEKSTPLTDFVRRNGSEDKHWINCINMGNTNRGESEGQAQRRGEQVRNARGHEEGYRVDMEGVPEMEKLRKLKEAVETQRGRTGEIMRIDLMDRESWRNTNEWTEEEQRWKEKETNRRTPTKGMLLTEIHKKNMEVYPFIALKGYAESTITTIGTMGEDFGTVITILVGFIPKEIQGILATRDIMKPRDWELTDTLVGHHLRGPLVDLNIQSLEMDTDMLANEKNLLTGREGMAARSMEIDIKHIERGSLKQIKHKKWEQMMTQRLRSSNAKIVYAALDPFIQLRGGLNMLLGSLELYKTEELKKTTIGSIMKDQWAHTARRTLKPLASTMRNAIKGVPRDPREKNRIKLVTDTAEKEVDDGLAEPVMFTDLENKRVKKEEDTIQFILRRLKINRARQGQGNEEYRQKTIEELKQTMDRMELTTTAEERIKAQLIIIEDMKLVDTDDYITGAKEFLDKCTSVGMRKRRLTQEEKEEDDDYKRCKRLTEENTMEIREKAGKLLETTESLIQIKKEIETKRDELGHLEERRRKIVDEQQVHLKGLEVCKRSELKPEGDWTNKEPLEQAKKQKKIRDDVIKQGNKQAEMKIILEDNEIIRLREQKRKIRDEMEKKLKENTAASPAPLDEGQEPNRREAAHEQQEMEIESENESLGQPGDETLEDLKAAASSTPTSEERSPLWNLDEPFNWAEDKEDSFLPGINKQKRNPGGQN